MGMPVRKKHLTTMDEIARLAKVSKPTVSRAFTDSPLVKSETKDRILAIARRHGYAVNSNSQKLRTNRTRTVAVVMHVPRQSNVHTSTPFYLQLLNDVARGLWMRRYDLLLCSPEPDDAYSYEILISSKRADGIIFLGQGAGDQWLNDLARTRVPFVVWGAVDPHFSYCAVGSDNRKGGELAGKRISELGRNQIVFVGNRSHPEMEQRRQGLEHALKLARTGARIIDVEIPDFTFETGLAAVTAFVARGLAMNALVAANDAVAMGAVRALKDAKLRVPEDVTVIGYNDLPIAQLIQTPLTTIRQYTHQAGSLLVDKLFQFFDAGRPSSSTVPTELVVRQT